MDTEAADVEAVQSVECSERCSFTETWGYRDSK